MIALDTNVLVHARREESGHHATALRIVTKLAGGTELWAIPWPCVYEYVRVVTHPRIFSPPSDLDSVLVALESLLSSPSLHLLGEGPSHFSSLKGAVAGGRATGNLAHDAHIAALALEHGVTELWTADRDFTRFPGLNVRNPFLSEGVHEGAGTYRTGRRKRSKVSSSS